ncbi:hypothetical protein PRIPAC_70685 [Pristionchus pacificus]|uniref:Uncharacterized protein n=1 Tax=Pristionchus pacificus TaxID=54126 RepID=A0A2A6CGB8_PRIPA|nr:hypothetical protein PRIPAC_70685 [Pristionchus pacificus]|eukprot:PDM77264.1 hypothetical protein PRIPAC_43176 [Pristionchus pacificus]
MFSPVTSSPLTSSPPSHSSRPSPTAEYTSQPTTPTEHEVSALTPSFAQSLALTSSRTSDEYSVYSNSSAPPPTPVHTLRRAADQLECRSDRIVSETIRLLREAELGYSMAEHLRDMAEEATSQLEVSDREDDVPSLSSIVPLRRKKADGE